MMNPFTTLESIADSSRPSWRRLLDGFTALLAGVRMLMSHGSMMWIALKIGVITISLLILWLIGAVFATTPLANWIGYSGVWYVLSWIGIFVAALPIVLVLHRASASLVVEPLLQSLSLQVDETLSPGREFPGDDSGLLDGIIEALRGLPGLLGLFCALLLLGFIPLIGPPLALVLGLYLSASDGARGLLALPLNNRGLDDAALDAALKAHRSLWIGVNAGVSVLLLIPFVNLIAIPAGVVAITQVYHRVEQASAHDEGA